MGELSGVRVLVTRPKHQADEFCKLVEQNGGESLRFPVVKISAIKDTRPLLEKIDRLDEFDIVIFISQNAASKAINSIETRRTWPKNLHIAAIGRKTGQELQRLGYVPDICPKKGFDSEALLQDPVLQKITGKKVLIFRGGVGREVLGDTLQQRGATVEYADAYQRSKPTADKNAILRDWSRHGIDIITITSAEGLRNLFDMVGKLGQFWLRSTPLVVGSERMLETAKKLGCKHPPTVADNPSNEAMISALLTWQKRREQK